MTDNQLHIQSFTFGPFQTNTYVVSMAEKNSPTERIHVCIIDPAFSNSYEQQELLNYIRSLAAQDESSNACISLLATHGHLDHLWGAAWATARWQTPVRMHPADMPMAAAMQQQYNLFGIPGSPQPFPIEPLNEDSFRFAHLTFRLLHTPGHTPGSICLHLPEERVLFSGDTLFRDGYGRTDLPGGSMAQLIASLERLQRLPSGTKVFPGHGDTTFIR